ncbi:MAG: hypothetical protein WD468_13165 [Pirellulales bacterium]
MLTRHRRRGILLCMATAPTEITEADILSEIVAPDQPTLSEASAREILALRFNQQAVDRMNGLAEKNRRGSLVEPERALLEKYQRVGNFLNLLQAKARLSLAHSSNGN